MKIPLYWLIPWLHKPNGSYAAYASVNGVAFGGNNPWIDIYAPPYNAYGDGVHLDTNAILNALSDAAQQSVDGAVTNVNAGEGTFLVDQQIAIPDKVSFMGTGRGSRLLAASSFPTNTPIVRLGNGSGLVFNTRLVNFMVDCNNVAGSVGVWTNESQEQSGLYRVEIIRYMSTGLQVDNGSEHSTFEDCEVSASASATNSVGILNGGDAHKFNRITITTEGGAAQQDKAIYNQGLGYFEDIHVENHAYGAYVDDTLSGSGVYGSGHLSGFDGATTVSTCVHLNTTAAFTCTDINKNGATVSTIDDLVNMSGSPITASYVPFYANYASQSYGAGLNMRSGLFPAHVDGTANLGVATFAGTGAPSGTPKGNPGYAFFFRADGSTGSYIYLWNGTTWTAIL